jgi:hypothetical protein
MLKRIRATIAAMTATAEMLEGGRVSAREARDSCVDEVGMHLLSDEAEGELGVSEAARLLTNPEEADLIRLADDGSLAGDGAPAQDVDAWLRVEMALAWARGDAARAHYCSAALAREPGEREAILNGRPSPGVRDGSARRSLDDI